MSNYFIAKAIDGGSDANSGTQLSPWLTVAHALTVMTSGDSLFFRGGTYSETIPQNGIPAGTSWSSPTTLSNYNGETVILTGSNPGNYASNQFYIHWNGFIFDGFGFIIDNGAHHVKLTNFEIKNYSGNGIGIGGAGVILSGGSIHDGGLVDMGPPHALYISGSDGLYEHLHIYNHSVDRPFLSAADRAGGGFHFYSGGSSSVTRNVIRYNTINNTELFGILLSSGADNSAYGNLIYSCRSDGGLGDGINIFTGAFRSLILNNTVYDCGSFGIKIDVAPQALGCRVQNNISYGNTGGQITTANDTTCIADHNLTTDPFFLSPGSGDFHLTLGSPAIDAGTIIDGIPYTGAAPDQGAFEFGGEDLPTPVVVITPNPLPPEGGGTIDYDSDGDTVDIPGVGTGLPPSGSVPLPPGQTLVVVIAYNVNGSISVQSTVGQFAGGITYRAAAGYMPRSIKGGADLSVDNSELVGIMANKAIANQLGFLIKGVLTDEDIEVGRFDNARDELFLVNYEDLSMGKYFLPSSGGIGQIKSKRGTFEAETRGKQYFLQQTFGDLISKLCRARLGDDVGDGTGEHDYKKQRFGCKVRIDPPFWRSNTAYTVRPDNDAALGSVVKPQAYNGRHFECIVAGTSAPGGGAFEPTWNLPVGSTTTDGSVTWRAILALEVFGSVTGTINRRFFQDSGRYEPPTTGIGINTEIAQYAIVAASISGNYFEIEGGDLTRIFLPSTTFAVTGSIANDATYTVTVSTLVEGRTRIVVSETIPDDRAGGSIGAPNALASGFFTNGLLTFLTGLNRGITMEIKEFTLGQYPLVDVDQGAFKFMLDGDVTASFVDGQRFAVAGSTGNDTEYNVVSVTYNIGTDQTEITVDAAIADATADGNVLAGPGQFELFERMPFDIELGDEYVASAGCDLSKAMCKFKFRNIYNRRAEDETPGTDVALLTPDRPQ